MAFYLLNKEKGITSNKALTQLKREIEFKKAGFSGVLDPFAEGLLIVATDGDTKLLELLLGADKTYEGTIKFGFSTDTYDIDGKIIDEKKDFNLDPLELKKIIRTKFVGHIEQIPPKASNIKVDGKRARELFKDDVEFELKPVKRHIYNFEVFSITKDSVDFKVSVSSGTYIRSLANDIGKEIGIPTTLTALKRTRIGKVELPNIDKKYQKTSRSEVIDLPTRECSLVVFRALLEGRQVSLPIELDEVILEVEDQVIWAKRTDIGMYKIHKRIA